MSTVVLPIPIGDPTRSRSLSSISTTETVRYPRPLPPRPNYVSLGSRPSSLMRPGSLGSVLQEPRILARLLCYVRWRDFQSLAITCRACSNVLHHPKLRDAVLSRFIPGYRYCLRHADTNTISSSIDVGFSDLSHFSEYRLSQLLNEMRDDRQPNQWFRSNYLCTTTPPLPSRHHRLLALRPQQSWKGGYKGSSSCARPIHA